jgi:hypothetical protein
VTIAHDRGSPVRGAAIPLEENPRRTASRSLVAGRQRILIAIAVDLALWAVLLAVVGIWMSSGADRRARSPLGNGTPALLWAGGALIALSSLALWATTLDRMVLLAVILRGIELASLFLALALLAMSHLESSLLRGPVAVAVVVIAAASSIAARLVRRRLSSQRATPR